MKSIRDLPLEEKRLFLRVDFNVPLAEGKVLDTTRIEETLPTIRHAVSRGARIVCASHLGKPKGKPKPELSLAPVAVELARELARPVRFAEDCVGPEVEKLVAALAPGEVLLLENLRFHAGEEKNDPVSQPSVQLPQKWQAGWPACASVSCAMRSGRYGTPNLSHPAFKM